jgi:glucokinase
MLLAGDVGGTKVDLGIFTSDAGPRAPLARAQFKSADFPGLAAIAERFLTGARFGVDRACFAVAGPVIDGIAKVTNLPWNLEEASLASELRVRSVRLMNDLEAVTTGAIGLPASELHPLNQGVRQEGGTIAVVAPGTGLGEGFATWDGAGYRAYPSEGGHADFAPADDLQASLLEFLRRRLGHVSVERVCSGIGIPSLYEYLRLGSGIAEGAALAAALLRQEDRTRTIVEAGLNPNGPDPLAAATVDLFVTILGAEAGNLALKVLSTGGVFLAGGIPAHVLPALDNGRFMRAFVAKGRLSAVLEKMPVHVVLARAALIGAATAGLGPDHHQSRGR